MPIIVSEVDVKRVLLDCLETRSWIITFLKEKYLNTNKEIACRKIFRCINKDHVINIGRYLDKVKDKWFNKINYKYVSHVSNDGGLLP